MKRNKVVLAVVSMTAIMIMLLSACTPADEGPVTFTVTGMVNNELALTDAGLHGMNIVNLTAEHPKNGMQDFTGVRLSELLDEAGVQEEGTILVLSASDGYTFEIDLEAVVDCTGCLVAFGDTEGDYSAVMPGQAGKGWVKGLVGIEVK